MTLSERARMKSAMFVITFYTDYVDMAGEKYVAQHKK